MVILQYSVITLLSIWLLFIIYLVTKKVRSSKEILELVTNKNEVGFDSLLKPAFFLNEEIICNKDGSVFSTFVYNVPDNESISDEEVNHFIALISQSISVLGDGVTVHIDTNRKDYKNYSLPDKNHFSDVFSLAVDMSRRERFINGSNLYISSYAITITWTPPKISQQKLLNSMISGGIDRKINNWNDEIIKKFDSKLQSFMNRLPKDFILDRLGSYKEGETTYSDLLSYYYYCVTGLVKKLAVPEEHVYLDSLIGAEFYHGTTPFVENAYLGVIAVDGFPQYIEAGVLDILNKMPIAYRWNIRLICFDENEALAILEKEQKKWQQKVRGIVDQFIGRENGKINKDALSMVNETDDTKAAVSSGNVGLTSFTGNIILRHEDLDKLAESLNGVVKVLSRTGFNGRIENINSTEAFLGSIPSHYNENVRRPLINTAVASCLIPTSSSWTGSPVAPCPQYEAGAPPWVYTFGRGNNPFFLNLHLSDLGHTLILGRSRSGKTTILGLLITQFLKYKNSQIFCFDKGLGLKPTTLAVDGNHYSIADDGSRLNFSPLSDLDTTTDRNWALNWITTILEINNLNPSPNQVKLISSAIADMASGNLRSLSDFIVTVQDEEIRGILAQYNRDGPLGELMDVHEDGLSFNTRVSTFEIEKLMDLGHKFSLPIFLYLFRKIEKSLDGRPSVIFIDEGWLVLAHEVFRNKLVDWLKSFGKKNCLVCLSTQNFGEVVNSGIFEVLITNTATKILLPNQLANDDEFKPAYKKLGLTDNQINLLANAVPKRDYLAYTEIGSKLFQIGLNDLELAVFGSGDKESLKEIQRLYDEDQNNWLKNWLIQSHVSKDSMRVFDSAELYFDDLESTRVNSYAN